MKIEATLTPELVEAINDLSVGECALNFIDVCDELKEFFMLNWDELPERCNPNKIVKTFLIKLTNMQKVFKNFVQEGCAQ